MLDAVSAHASYAYGLLDSLERPGTYLRLQLLLKHFEVRVKCVSATDALLFGADACIDPISRTIRIRRDIDILHHREILAHEIAHVILGHDSTGEVAQRRNTVSAYGRNERIERMADNLAAMLLVSDSELDDARRGNKAFVDAARYLDVSTDTLIRRLTQHQSPVIDVPRSRFKLSKCQQDAVDVVGNISIDGGVATGKTEVLLERLIRLAECQQAGHSRILFVTYLRKHMVYLFERLTKVAPLLAERVNFTTFHDYAADIILRNYTKAGWLSMPTVVGKGEVAGLLRASFPDASSEDLLQKGNQFSQSLRGQFGDEDDWQPVVTEQLYQLNYIHNGSLGKIASRLMEIDAVAIDEGHRWDAIFVDNYEQLTYEELTVLRLSSRFAANGLSVSRGYSALPYVYRGVNDLATAKWKDECKFHCYDFANEKNWRCIPKQTSHRSIDPLSVAVQTIQCIASDAAPAEKIIVATRHNSVLNHCKNFVVREFPELISGITGPERTIERLYDLIDDGAGINTFLDAWWAAYRDITTGQMEFLKEALVNVQMYMSHRSRSLGIGLPEMKLRTYLQSIRPFHQYKDIGMSERLSFQTLHSLSGGEVEHLIILLDDLSDRATLEQMDVELLDNAVARATHTLTLIAGNVPVPGTG